MRTTFEVAPTDTAAMLDALAYVISQARKTFRDKTRMLSLSWNRAHGGRPQFMSEYRRQVTERMGMLEAILAAGQESGSARPICWLITFTASCGRNPRNPDAPSNIAINDSRVRTFS